MNAIEFKKVLDASLLECGLRREKGAYYKRSDEVICVVGLQKASFADSYYVNVGYVIRAIHPEVVCPRYYECDIGARFTFVMEEKELDLFDPNQFGSDDDLRKVVLANAMKLTDGIASISDLKALLARNPTMLYQTTVQAKKTLGL